MNVCPKDCMGSGGGIADGRSCDGGGVKSHHYPLKTRAKLDVTGVKQNQSKLLFEGKCVLK